MPEAFVSLSHFLQSTREVTLASQTVNAEVSPDSAMEIDGTDRPEMLDQFIRDIKRTHAALADALDLALDDLLRDIAADVIGREMRLAPVELERIVQRALARAAAESPLAVRVHPDDCESLADCGMPIVSDAEMRRGDAVIQVRFGTIDVSLGTRLEELLVRMGAR